MATVYSTTVVTLLTVLVVFSNFESEISALKVQLIPIGTKIESNCYGKHINISCTLRPGLSVANQTFNCDIELFREIKEMKLVVSYYTITMNRILPAALVKRSLDVCFFLRNPKSDRLVSTVYNYVRKHSNVPLRCPMLTGNYYVRDLRLDDVPVPAFLPETEFMLEVIFRSEVKHETLLEFMFYGKLVRFIEMK
ncbi:uncharacterized protein LOC126567617 [Anopheles maculipalpis]|uniref:uncharacterized protein LOC126567617 n=1 Tax=Anopheles maculipalpis TaxID=1496333 RepID=UPI002158B747|nr:uncharacterized protein LOC126567617 [Anopheles maculipalpis]